MVFRTKADPADGSEGCGCHTVESWTELDCRRYSRAGDAQKGHEEFVANYRILAEAEAKGIE